MIILLVHLLYGSSELNFHGFLLLGLNDRLGFRLLNFMDFLLLLAYFLIELYFSLDELSHFVLGFALELYIFVFGTGQLLDLFVDIAFIFSSNLQSLLFEVIDFLNRYILEVLHFAIDFSKFIFKDRLRLFLHLYISGEILQLLVSR